MDIATAAMDARELQIETQAESSSARLRRVFESACDCLYRYIMVRVGLDRDAADDLLQQTCHEAARNGRVPSDDASCEAWLRGIARNLIRRHWRERNRLKRFVSVEDARIARQLVEDMDARPLPAEYLARKEIIESILLAVTSLPAADQQLVLGFYFEGRSQSDIAARCGASIKSVEMKLHRVRARLRTILRHLDKEE